jgi:caffeoyl-CoA O-methyltransferase
LVLFLFAYFYRMSFNLIADNLQVYCDQNTSAASPDLQALDRHTHANILQPRMLSGHFQGRLLSMISCMVKPKYILEIGTYTGYSAICLAEGLQADGKLITIDVNPENEDLVNEYIEKTGNTGKIQAIIGDAYQVMRSLNYAFDLVFIDADKPNYPKYYELVVSSIPAGAFILIDNVLWSGKVLDASHIANDKDTRILHQLNRDITLDTRVENILLPFRDGMMLVRKK